MATRIKSKDPMLLAVIRAIQGFADKPEPGFYTPTQLRAKWGINQTTVTDYIKHGLKAGIYEKKVYRVQTAAGNIAPIAHYRLKKGAKR